MLTPRYGSDTRRISCLQSCHAHAKVQSLEATRWSRLERKNLQTLALFYRAIRFPAKRQIVRAEPQTFTRSLPNSVSVTEQKTRRLLVISEEVEMWTKNSTLAGCFGKRYPVPNTARHMIGSGCGSSDIAVRPNWPAVGVVALH